MKIEKSEIRHIAFTGHRLISHNTTHLQHSMRQVFTDISREFGESEIILYSALAEGSDQLVAEIALEYENIRLHVPLPMVIEDYLETFNSEKTQANFQALISNASCIELLPAAKSPQDAYQALGLYLVEHADILLAVWNGEYNQKKGGTSEVVRTALAAGKTVYWIFCPNEAQDADNSIFSQKELGEVEILQYWDNSNPTILP